jgi:hypothetical protein
MAGVRIEMAPDWQENLRAAEWAFLDEQLGPLIFADMQAITPVLSGRLVAAEKFQVVNVDGVPQLQVGVWPDDDGPLEYVLAVEYGFHGEEWVRTYVNHDFFGTGSAALIRAHSRMGNSPEQSYMRTALYRVRAP